MNLQEIKSNLSYLSLLSIDDKIREINEIRKLLSEHSPFNEHPIDCVQWIKADSNLESNDYNPNSVASTEMKLLEISLLGDGFTQPIVTTTSKNVYEIVDGFHRTTLAKTSKKVSESTKGFIPIVLLKKNTDKEARMASTVRHNRARGVHSIEAMSKIVQDLKRRGWMEEKIGKELGMEPDEVLRLLQTLGLSELYKDQEYSFSWEPV